MPHDAEGKGREPSGKRGAEKASAPATSVLTDDQVAAYLNDHPDFLARHSDLLEVLVPPERLSEGLDAAGNVVVDLQRFMLERLRKELGGLRDVRDQLISAGRANMTAQSRIHEAVLAVIAARSFEQLIDVITTDLAVLLDLDAAVLCVETREDGLCNSPVKGVRRLESGTIKSILGPKRRLLLRGDISGDPEVFGNLAGLVRSDALLRLDISPMSPPALVALGTREAEGFDPRQATELLEFLRRSLELSVRAWLDLPE